MTKTTPILNSATREQAAVDEGLRSHMLTVYREMATALGISGGVAWAIGQDLRALRDGASTLLPEGMLVAMYTAPLAYVFMFAPLAVVLFLGFKMYSMSPAGARFALYSFAALMGISMATIFAVFTGMSIAQAFFATAAGLGGLSLWGYTTKKDLSGWGSFLFMGVIALVFASILNIFIGSSGLGFAVSAIAVLVFSALMAYDTQRVKNDYLQLRNQVSGDQLSTMGTAGALSMYINFINVFLSLLQLFGNQE